MSPGLLLGAIMSQIVVIASGSLSLNLILYSVCLCPFQWPQPCHTYGGIIIPPTSADSIVAQNLFSAMVILKASIPSAGWTSTYLCYSNGGPKCNSSELEGWNWQRLAKTDGSTYLISVFIKGISDVWMKHVNVKQLGHVEQNDTVRKLSFE